MAPPNPTPKADPTPPPAADTAAVEQALNQAQSSVDALRAAAAGELEAAPAALGGLDLLGDVDLNVSIELGRTEMLVEDVLRLGEGSVVELVDKLAGDPVDVYVNNRLIARGEVLVLNDNFCIRVNEILEDLEAQAEQAAEEESDRPK